MCVSYYIHNIMYYDYYDDYDHSHYEFGTGNTINNAYDELTNNTITLIIVIMYLLRRMIFKAVWYWRWEMERWRSQYFSMRSLAVAGIFWGLA